MQFQTYQKYKPSGIDWLGEIPEGWDTFRINWINSIVRGNSSFKKDELLESGEYIALQYGKTYKVDEIDETFNFYVNSEFYKPDQVVNHGNIILVSTSETIEDLGHTCFYDRKELGLIGGEQILLKPKNKFIFEKYLYYYSKVFCKELRKYSTGLKVYRFNIDDLKNIFIPIPNKQTQTAIADYLDQHTALIDKKIELLKAKKQSYTQLKQTLINEVVTKGLDKTVEMKDSGIEWIGQIPKHWEVKRLKDLINIFTGNSIAEKDLFLNKKNSYPYIATKDIDIETNQIDYNNGIYIPKSDKNFKIAKKDSVLLCIEGANAGKKIAQTEMDICFVNKQCAMKSLNNKVVERYLFYFIQGGIFKSQFFLVLNGLIGGVSINLIKRIFLVIPQKSEQIAIANYLDEKTSKIDQIIKKIDKNILALQEFRKTLINDVVTGKVKVL